MGKLKPQEQPQSGCFLYLFSLPLEESSQITLFPSISFFFYTSTPFLVQFMFDKKVSISQCIKIYLYPFSSSKPFSFSFTFSSPYHHFQSSQLRLSILFLNLSHNFICLFKIKKREVLTFILRSFSPHCVLTLFLSSVCEKQMPLIFVPGYISVDKITYSEILEIKHQSYCSGETRKLSM